MPFKQINVNKFIQQKRKSEDFNLEYLKVKQEYNHLEMLMDKIIDENKQALLALNEQNNGNESSECMNIEIIGYIDVTNNPVSIDELNDMFIEWIEANGWYFGGVMKDATD